MGSRAESNFPKALFDVLVEDRHHQHTALAAQRLVRNDRRRLAGKILSSNGVAEKSRSTCEVMIGMHPAGPTDLYTYGPGVSSIRVSAATAAAMLRKEAKACNDTIDVFGWSADMLCQP